MSAAPPSQPLTYFESQPSPDEVPRALANPFVEAEPHPLARRAAEALRRRLRELPAGVDLAGLERPGGGKMFGVLVVEGPGGRIGYLSAFSGMLGQRWEVEGFVPPLFDAAARDAFWPAGEAELDAYADRHAELCAGAEPTALRAQLAELTRVHRAAASTFREHPVARRRELRAAQQAARAPLLEALQSLELQRTELERLRAERSRALWQQLSETYVLPNARGEVRSVGALFAPEPPPGGAGDCAAPKLLAYAYRHGLRPLALAEFWWGAPPLTGERRAGGYYPACERKCGRVLPFMLEGLPLEGPPLARAAPPAPEPLRVLHEDAWLLAVDKPAGLLCVPGRHAPTRDSALVRLAGAGPLRAVQAPDAEASGLLLFARDDEALAALQRQLARREAHARSVAWLDGAPGAEGGEVALPLRSDPVDRLRQAVDPAHGKRALTQWRVLQRAGERTRVELVPRTARPHQLRVHAAHPLGLGVPIAGDRLYGRGGPRLLLHAHALHFVHPRTQQPLLLECPAPF